MVKFNGKVRDNLTECYNQRTGKPKLGFDTFVEAEDYIKRNRYSGSVYKCNLCGYFHYSSKDLNRSKGFSIDREIEVDYWKKKLK